MAVASNPVSLAAMESDIQVRVEMGTVEQDIHINTVKARERTRGTVATLSASLLLVIVLLSFVILGFGDNEKFENLKKLLHILIPPLIGIFGAIIGFYFGEKNAG